MSADGKIYITISDSRESEIIKGTKINAPSEGKKEKEKTTTSDFIKHQFFNFIESEAKQMVNYTLGNIGNFTGDYNAQRQVNFGLSAASVITNIGMSALAGSKFGIPGAIAGAVVAATSQAVSFGLQLRTQNLEITKQNYSIGQLKQLSGLDGLTNGSRI
jgi:hypothetical protein